MAIQRPAEGAVVRKADFDRNDQHSLSSGRGLRRAAAPTVEGGCALDSRPGTPDCSKAAPVGRPARTGWEGPAVLPRRHCAASAPLNYPSPAPSMRPYVPAENSRRYPEGDTDTVAHKRDARALPMHLAPAATLGHTGYNTHGPADQPLQAITPPGNRSPLRRSLAHNPKVRRELNTRPGLRALVSAPWSPRPGQGRTLDSSKAPVGRQPPLQTAVQQTKRVKHLATVGPETVPEGPARV